MADFADVAETIIEQDLEHQLANMPKFDEESLAECEQCEELIPMQRRKLGGVRLCIGCQTVVEQKNKHFGVKR